VGAGWHGGNDVGNRRNGHDELGELHFDEVDWFDVEAASRYKGKAAEQLDQEK
jgi:hypothetical protein